MAAHRGTYRRIWGALALLAIANVMFLVNGRTGQLIMMAMIALFIWQQLGVRSIKYFVLVAMVGMLVIKVVPTIQQSRLSIISQEVKDPNSSAGLRMGFYKNSIELIKKHPMLGVGTGSFKPEYAEQIGLTEGLQATSNPHNQYLLIAIETGLIGLFVFLFFLLSAWRSSAILMCNLGLTSKVWYWFLRSGRSLTRCCLTRERAAFTVHCLVYW